MAGVPRPLDVALIEVGHRGRWRSSPPPPSATTKPGWTAPTRSSSRSIAGRTRRWKDARYLLRHRLAAEPRAHSAHPSGRPYRREHFRCDPERSSRSSKPTRRTATCPSPARCHRPRHRRTLHRILRHEVAKGRLPARLLPLQSGVGNVANAVLSRAARRAVREPDRLYGGDPGRHAGPAGSGKLRLASATAFSLSPDAAEELNADMAKYPQENDPAAAGNQQPPGTDPPAGLHRHERAD